MAKSRRRDDGGGLDRVFEIADEATPGLHDLDPPTGEIPAGLPEPLIELYAHCNGGRLFHDTVTIAPATDVTMNVPGRWQFATLDEDIVSIDHRGRIWRTDTSLDDDICEGTRLDRWLAGTLEATAL